MSICLHYRTTQPVSPEVLDAVRVELLTTHNDDRPWVLCEPLRFPVLESERPLEGWSKLNLQPHPDDLREASLFLAKEHDLRALARLLSAFSAQHAVDWQLDVESETIGRIVGGVCEPKLLVALDSLAELHKDLGPQAATEAARQLDHEAYQRPVLRIYRGPE